jgi:hypothetical protein
MAFPPDFARVYSIAGRRQPMGGEAIAYLPAVETTGRARTFTVV